MVRCVSVVPFSMTATGHRASRPGSSSRRAIAPRGRSDRERGISDSKGPRYSGLRCDGVTNAQIVNPTK
jgi:hypothetical protein